MSQQLNITVMMGGPSAEWEVSQRSGAAVARALSSLGHNVSVLDPRNKDWKLSPSAQVVFLALHGTYGEDGTVQQQLETMGVPYTGCGVQASRLAFDKLLAKQKFIDAGVPTAKYAVINSASAPWPADWQPPVVLKPARQGSSVGLQFVHSESDWPAALAEAFRFDTEVLMEEKIEGRETTVAVLFDKPLPIVEIRTKQGFYDYRNKYTAGANEYFCPAPFDETTTLRVQAAAMAAYKAIGGRDYARVDVMVKPNGDPVVLEVNTLPGMTETSLFPKAASAAGIAFPQLCELMVSLALQRGAKPQPKA